MNNAIFGIDFGSKLTGNTVIAIYIEGKIMFLDVDKGVDADDFIFNAASHFKPDMIFIDAPLSLPGVYQGLSFCDNYHFRNADLELHAMSPMFLGGLAARAIELKDRLKKLDIEAYETYPRALAGQLKLKLKGYKGSSLGLKDCRKAVIARFNNDIEVDPEDIKTWHHMDALLALMAALKKLQGESEVFGREEEGLIYV